MCKASSLITGIKGIADPLNTIGKIEAVFNLVMRFLPTMIDWHLVGFTDNSNSLTRYLWTVGPY